MSSNEKNIDQLLKESVQFEIENPIDFSHVYLIQITNSKKLVITEQKEDKKAQKESERIRKEGDKQAAKYHEESEREIAKVRQKTASKILAL